MKFHKGDLLQFNENQNKSNPSYTGYIFIVEEVQEDGNLRIRCIDPYNIGHHKETRYVNERANKSLTMLEEA